MNEKSTTLNLQKLKYVVEAKPRRLSAQWTYEDPRTQNPVFHDLGLIETARVQHGKVNWDGYDDNLTHYVGLDVEKELSRILYGEIKNDD
jgi:hypothetical protein